MTAAAPIGERFDIICIGDVAVDLDRGLVEAVSPGRRAHRLVQQLDRRHALHHERHRARVAARHLQEVFDE